MKISNDVSSFKGFAVQASRDCVNESMHRVRKAAEGKAFNRLLITNSRTMNHAVKAFNKGARKLVVQGCV